MRRLGRCVGRSQVSACTTFYTGETALERPDTSGFQEAEEMSEELASYIRSLGAEIWDV